MLPPLFTMLKKVDPAEKLSVKVFAEGTNLALVCYFDDARNHGGAARWDRWDRLSTRVPLRQLKRHGPGRYRAELRPCDSTGKCGAAAKIYFDYEGATSNARPSDRISFNNATLWTP